MKKPKLTNQPLKFTKRLPKKPGFYWMLPLFGGGDPFIGEVWLNWRTQGVEVMIRADSYDCNGWLYAGPIIPPED